MKALRIQNVYFTFSKTEKAKAFYQELLSLNLRFEDGERWTQYDLKGHNLALASHDEAGPLKNAIVVVEVDSDDHLQERVESLGGTLAGTRDMGSHGTVHTVLDPEGNMFQLFIQARTEPK